MKKNMFPIQAVFEKCGIDEWFSQSEMQTILMSVILARDDERNEHDSITVPTVELEAVMAWCDKTRFQAAMLENVLSGDMLIDITPEGEIRLGPTPAGARFVQDLVQKATANASEK